MVKDVSPTALVITYSDTQANKLYEDLSFFLGENIMYFPLSPPCIILLMPIVQKFQ